jgi:hypothetical protein
LMHGGISLKTLDLLSRFSLNNSGEVSKDARRHS